VLALGLISFLPAIHTQEDKHQFILACRDWIYGSYHHMFGSAVSALWSCVSRRVGYESEFLYHLNILIIIFRLISDNRFPIRILPTRGRGSFTYGSGFTTIGRFNGFFFLNGISLHIVFYCLPTYSAQKRPPSLVCVHESVMPYETGDN
jgi:hypothetical protein